MRGRRNALPRKTPMPRAMLRARPNPRSPRRRGRFRKCRRASKNCKRKLLKAEKAAAAQKDQSAKAHKPAKRRRVPAPPFPISGDKTSAPAIARATAVAAKRVRCSDRQSLGRFLPAHHHGRATARGTKRRCGTVKYLAWPQRGRSTPTLSYESLEAESNARSTMFRRCRAALRSMW